MKILSGVLLFVFFSITVNSQEQPPQLLFLAAQCLMVKHFLPSSKTGTLNFGYILDDNSYPGDTVIYIVNYSNRVRSKGLVFAVFLNKHGDGQNFNIQNNASFVLSNSELSGVSFVNPPLGGIWTQGHLAAAIKKIEKQPRYTVSVKDLLLPKELTSCEAYTDPQKK